MKFNDLNRKKACAVFACVLVAGVVTVYAVNDSNSNKDNRTSSLNAGVSLALNANEIESLDVTAGVADLMYDTSKVEVTDTNLGKVAQPLAKTGGSAAVSEEKVLTDETVSEDTEKTVAEL